VFKTSLRAVMGLACLCACALAPTAAQAVTVQASLHASFSPNRLSTPTTIAFGFNLRTAEGTAPPPLSSLKLQMPAGLDYTATTLGLAICKPSTLLARGLSGCSPNSRLGYGNAVVEVPFGTGSGHEIPEIQAVAGPSPHGNLVVLFYANGVAPVDAQLAFSGEVLPDTGRFGSKLVAEIPVVKSVPGGPDVSIVSVQTTIGPSHLLYYKRVHGRRVAYHPRGLSVPSHCPTGGFPFVAEFAFQDGSRTSASTAVPCPPRHR
jgi:hypothetical protein